MQSAHDKSTNPRSEVDEIHVLSNEELLDEKKDAFNDVQVLSADDTGGEDVPT